MPRMILLFLPYALQLLCIVHAVRNRKDSFWIWIIIIVPYVGGLAYLLVEILPGLLAGRGARELGANLASFVRPGAKTEQLRQKAEYSATHNNLVEYADALFGDGEYAKALEIYRGRNQGHFQGDRGLVYKIALAEYELGNYAEAGRCLEGIIDREGGSPGSAREILLSLLILERTGEEEACRKEYERLIELKGNIAFELQYLRYLARLGRAEAALGVVERLRNEERMMRINRIRYDRSPYREAYALGRRLGKPA